MFNIGNLDKKKVLFNFNRITEKNEDKNKKKCEKCKEILENNNYFMLSKVFAHLIVQ